MEIFLGSHHFLLIMKHTPPLLDLPALAVLSARKTEKLSDGITAVSGTKVLSHVSDKQRMLQSLILQGRSVARKETLDVHQKKWVCHIYCQIDAKKIKIKK